MLTLSKIKMLEKSKVKYISYNFFLVPFIVLLFYIISEYISLNILFGQTNYQILHLLFAVFGLSLFMFILGILFGSQSQFIKDLIRCNIILYLSFIFVAVIYWARLNLGNINYCAFDYDVNLVSNIYALVVICTSIINITFYSLIKYLNIEFKLINFLVLLSGFLLFQFLATKGFRQF